MIDTDGLKEKVHNTYFNIFKAKYKREPSQSDRATVLAAFVLQDKQTEEFHVASLATGTKSLPIELLEKYDRLVLRDMHAEVLARRAFLHLLRDSVGMLEQKDLAVPYSALFEIDSRRNKLRLNSSRYRLILYTTELPCGSCTIDKQSSLFSGAKPLSSFGSTVYGHGQQFVYNKSVLRTKPGRSDLPLNKRSCSLSCSDKLMMWAVLGVQGKKLFRYFLPIYIDTLVVETVSETSIASLQQALDLKHRLAQLLHRKQTTVQRKLFNVIIDGKERPFTRQFRCLVPEIIKTSQEFNAKKDETATKKTDSSLIVDYKGVVEECNGHTGLKHGCSIKQLAKGVSQYSSNKLVDDLEQSPILHYQYAALKDRIKHLFGGWTTQHKPWRKSQEKQDRVETVTLTEKHEPPLTTGSFQS